MSNRRRFQYIAAQLSQINAAREKVILDAFGELEARDPALATLLLQRIGERSRAARWMSSHQRAFGGLSAYDLLADGDVDAIWDELAENGSSLAIEVVRSAAY